MRRGLMHWDARELSVEVLEARIARLRAAMRSVGLDAFILYTNLVRPSAVAHLTGFTPYWSEGLLLVPAAGRLLFATALSNRVADWIRSTNPVSEVVSTPRPGKLLGERFAKDASVKRVGVLELDAMPSELADDLAAAAPAIAWIDGSAPFASIRRRIDAVEQTMLAHADALAVARSIRWTRRRPRTPAAWPGSWNDMRVSLAPRRCMSRSRLISPPTAGSTASRSRLALADRFAVRTSVAYKGSWVRRTRTFAQDGAVARADVWFDGVMRGIVAGKPIGVQLAAQAQIAPRRPLAGWLAESSLGSYPLAVHHRAAKDADRRQLPGADDRAHARRRSVDRQRAGHRGCAEPIDRHHPRKPQAGEPVITALALGTVSSLLGCGVLGGPLSPAMTGERLLLLAPTSPPSPARTAS